MCRIVMSATTNSPSNKKLIVILITGLIIVSGFTYWLLENYLMNDNYSNLDVASSKVDFKSLEDFEFKSLNGKNYRIKDFENKVVILNFWASWCPPCLEEIPSMAILADEYKEDLVILAFSGDESFEEAQKAIAKFNIDKENFISAWDIGFKVANTFKVGKIPESFIFKKGLLFHRKVEGSVNWMSPFSIKEVKSLISEQ